MAFVPHLGERNGIPIEAIQNRLQEGDGFPPEIGDWIRELGEVIQRNNEERMRRNNEQRIRRNMIQFGTFAVLGGLASFALGTANHSLQPLPEFDPAALARSCRESLDRYGQDFTASQNLRIQSEDPQIPDSLVPCPSPPCKGETVLPLS